METEDIRRAVWTGSIACQIDLDAMDAAVFHDAEPYYLSVPRVAYLPIYLEEIREFFNPLLQSVDEHEIGDAWFEFENVPMKWHWPIGVLYDLFTGKDPATCSDDDHPLPWKLTLHFRNFPSKHVMRLEAASAFHDAWVNMVKEADHVRNGNARAYMHLSMLESAALWEGLQTHDFDAFWAVNEKLLSAQTPPLTRNIPLRVYVPSAPRVIQEQISPYHSNSKRELQTLGTVLCHLLPDLFPTRRTAVFARPVVHGAAVAMDTPLAELACIAIYPDGFLHITLAMML